MNALLLAAQTVTEQQPETWFEKYSDGFFIIIGGLIATLTTLITLYIARKQEKRKEKKRLKAELYNAVYTFYNWRKTELKISNEQSLRNATAKVYFRVMRNKEAEDEKRKIAAEAYINVRAEMSDSEPKLEQIFDRLVEVEGKIIGLMIEIQDAFGYEIYRSINALLEPEIEKSNVPSSLHDYAKATEFDLSKYGKTLMAEIKTATFALHTKWKVIRKEMDAVFPKL